MKDQVPGWSGILSSIPSGVLWHTKGEIWWFLPEPWTQNKGNSFVFWAFPSSCYNVLSDRMKTFFNLSIVSFVWLRWIQVETFTWPERDNNFLFQTSHFLVQACVLLIIQKRFVFVESFRWFAKKLERESAGLVNWKQKRWVKVVFECFYLCWMGSPLQ